MNKLLIIVLSCLFSFGISCKDKFDKHIKELEKLNSHIKKGNWIEEQYYKIPKEEYFLWYKVANDTVYNLEFIITSPEREYKLGELQMRYSDSLYNYNLLMNKDTLYHYMESKRNGSKIFLAGKYYYIFETPKERERLNECEIKYLIDNIDSLKLIKGNVMPEFPCND